MIGGLFYSNLLYKIVDVSLINRRQFHRLHLIQGVAAVSYVVRTTLPRNPACERRT